MRRPVPQTGPRDPPEPVPSAEYLIKYFSIDAPFVNEGGFHVTLSFDASVRTDETSTFVASPGKDEGVNAPAPIRRASVETPMRLMVQTRR